MPNELSPPRQYILVDSSKIAYITVGNPSSPPLILVHGWLSALADWRLLLPTLAKTHYCIAVDLLGHGDSDKPRDGDYSIPTQAHRVMTVVDTLGVHDFTLCGHSMGGMIAFYITALLAPSRVRQIINLAGVINKDDRQLGKWLVRTATRAPFLVDWGFALSRWAAQFTWGQMLVPAAVFYTWKRPVGYADNNLRYSVQQGMETPFWRVVENIMALDMSPHLPNITCPVLTVFGQQDNIVALSQAQLAQMLIPHHTLHIIPQCGHYLILEKPEVCLKKIQAFLAQQ